MVKIEKIQVGSLFTGIGGIELGLERTGGFESKWFVEIDPFCQRVIKKHWPEVPIYGDIKEIDWDPVPKVDMLTGGFPCQDISFARGKGIEGSRSGLWREYAKAIRELRPKYALIENVTKITRKGLNVVLADLAQAGYDAEWINLRASDFGAPHQRERIFIVAYTRRVGLGSGGSVREERQILSAPEWKLPEDKPERDRRECGTDQGADTSFARFRQARRVQDLQGGEGIPQPLLFGGPDGIPDWVDRIKALGNAVVPDCTELIGEMIMDYDP